MGAFNEGLKGVAAIFDMDGTLIDNTPYHFKAWQQLFNSNHLPQLTRETYLTQISGVPIRNTLQTFFNGLSDADMELLAKQKKELYQEAFKPYLQPVTGLENFLSELKDAGVKIALATSSNQDDIDFIFNGIPIGRYFDALVTGGMVSQPKPSPQIFLKAAEQLNTRPEKCLVFEDSIAGLKAGRSAGMRVVGIATAHPREAIAPLASMVISDYAGISLKQLAQLFEY